MTKVYRVRAFADLAGVTVRALHHYDRLGLLRPTRTDSGYRMYALPDLERLEQIVALKFLGIPLKQIKAVLDRDARALPDVLRAQRRALEDKRCRLTRAIDAIADAERSIQPGRPADTAVLKHIIEVIEMQDNQAATDSLKKYYSDDAWAELAKRRAEMTPEMRTAAEAGERQWAALFADITASLDEDPAAPKAQALLDRWTALVQSFTQGNAEVTEGLGRAWADRQNWPAQMKKQSEPFIDPRAWEFIRKVSAARKG